MQGLLVIAKRDVVSVDISPGDSFIALTGTGALIATGDMVMYVNATFVADISIDIDTQRSEHFSEAHFFQLACNFLTVCHACPDVEDNGSR
jgi:hypothetical protein